MLTLGTDAKIAILGDQMCSTGLGSLAHPLDLVCLRLEVIYFITCPLLYNSVLAYGLHLERQTRSQDALQLSLVWGRSLLLCYSPFSGSSWKEMQGTRFSSAP